MNRVRQFVPGGLYGAPLRWATPRLAGVSPEHHIALTFDDGPDPRSTPVLLETLARHDVRATFFLIGEHVEQHPQLVRDMHEAGHEIAVHGWTHTCTLRVPPLRLRRGVTRTAALLTEITGLRPRWYRPPYGITTLATKDAARAAGLTPVLWTAWGRDWSQYVGPDGVVARVQRTLRPGGTVLLHDTDRYASPHSWQRTNAAVDRLLPLWRSAGVPVGPLLEHWAN